MKKSSPASTSPGSASKNRATKKKPHASFAPSPAPASVAEPFFQFLKSGTSTPKPFHFSNPNPIRNKGSPQSSLRAQSLRINFLASAFSAASAVKRDSQPTH